MLEGCRIITLHTLPGLRRGEDWSDEFVVGRVLGVDPTPSAPRGALRFWGREGKKSGGGTTSGGYRCIDFDDIVELVGDPSPPRPTTKETRVEQREVKRAERRHRRKARRRS